MAFVILAMTFIVTLTGRFSAEPAPASGVTGQDGTSVWDGVYTAVQAARGRVVVQTHCVECHGEDLSGTEGPSLVGNTFMLKWEAQNLERLFGKIRETMPSGAVDRISDEQKLDALAYLLQENGFPAGMRELSQKADVFASIRIMPKEGPGPPRGGAVVEAIGCLAQGPGNEWVLSNSTGPHATTLDTPTAADRKAAETTPLGTETLRLLSVFPSPAAHKGHTMQAKGLLIKDPAGDRINVFSLEMVTSTCGQ